MSWQRSTLPAFHAAAILGLTTLLSCLPATSGAAEPSPKPPNPDAPAKVFKGVPEEARVREIAGYLRPEPAGLGRPITDRAAWAAAYPNPQTIIQMAEHAQHEAIPDLPDDLYLVYTRTGSRDEYQAPYGRRTQMLSDLVLAECIEDQGRFLPAIEAMLNAILTEKTWTMPAHDPALVSFKGNPIVDLGECMRSWSLATVDYVLGAKLKPETRAKIRTEVDRRVFQPYREQVLGKGRAASWVTTDNNWNAVCHGGVVGSALALLPKAEDRAWFLASMEIHLRNYLAGFTPDGYCSEGMGYWNYGFGHYTELAQAVGNATNWRMNLFAPPLVRNVLAFPDRLEMVPGVYPAFSDNNPSNKPMPWVFQVAGRKVTGGPLPAHPLTPTSAPRTASGLLYETMTIAFLEPPAASAGASAAPAKPEIALRDGFPDAGVAISRPRDAASGKGLAVAIKAGHNNEHHNHNDVGTYVVAIDGKTPVLDVGGEIYTARTFSPRRYDSKVLSSYGHDVPVVAGKLQDTGAAARGTLTLVKATENEDEYLLDLTKAYSQSVPSLRKLTRRLRYFRQPQPAVEVTDEAEFDSPQAFGTALMTIGKAELRPDHTVIVYDGSAALRVTVDTGGQPYSAKDEVFDEKLSSGKKARRIGLSLDQPATKARITCRLEPVATPVASGSAVLDKGAASARDPRWDQAVRVEAEAFSEQTGGKVETTPKMEASGGLAIREWNNDGHEVSWKFSVPRAGNYGVFLRYCSGDASDTQRTLKIDGAPAPNVQGLFAFPPTGGFSTDHDDWREVWLAQADRVYSVPLPAGEHVVALKNSGGGPLTLDWISLVPYNR